jgi:catechol 2,3-dioxygenase-like lactoylglutathione lyase family enzyme
MKKKAAKRQAAGAKGRTQAKKRTNAKGVRAASKTPVFAAKKSSRAPTGAKKTGRAMAPKKAAAPDTSGELSFNHAMIYLKDVAGGIDFYRSWLGFKLIEDFRHEGRSVYARMHAPGGDGTIALHQAGPGASIASDGVRLYFEVRDLDDFCQRLRRRGFIFTQQPQMMPWGWRHAYLNDPEGHEISLYWAGENRMKKTVMKTAKEAGAR